MRRGERDNVRQKETEQEEGRRGEILQEPRSENIANSK